jgi:hypothetical protein
VGEQLVNKNILHEKLKNWYYINLDNTLKKPKRAKNKRLRIRFLNFIKITGLQIMKSNIVRQYMALNKGL